MNRKRFLKWATALLLLVGIIYAAIPFVGSLKPSARAEAALPRVDISGIKPGTFVIIPHPKSIVLHNQLQLKLFIFRNQQGDVRVWSLITKDGGIGLPDQHWWRPQYFCKDFGPTLVNGIVDESLPIRCHDNNAQSAWVFNTWRWDINGKSLGDMKADLEPMKGSLKGNYFVLYKSD